MCGSEPLATGAGPPSRAGTLALIESAIYWPARRRTGLQLSFTCEGATDQMPLRDESLDDVRQWTGAHVFDTTVKYFSGALTATEYRQCRHALATTALIAEPAHTCFVFGYGSQTRYAYGVVSGHNDIELLWTGPCLPLLLWPLSVPVACQSGLLRINDATAVRVALQLLSYRGMVELLWCSSSLAQDVQRHVRRNRWRARPGNVVGRDPTYFLFGVERDHPTYATGIVGWSSFGPKCPSELQAIPLGLAG